MSKVLETIQAQQSNMIKQMSMFQDEILKINTRVDFLENEFRSVN